MTIISNFDLCMLNVESGKYFVLKEFIYIVSQTLISLVWYSLLIISQVFHTTTITYRQNTIVNIYRNIFKNYELIKINSFCIIVNAKKIRMFFGSLGCY